MRRVKNLNIGDSLRITGYQEDSAHAARLQSLGLVPGTTFTITRIAPLGDPFEISVRGYRLGLRKADALCLEVIPISKS